MQTREYPESIEEPDGPITVPTTAGRWNAPLTDNTVSRMCICSGDVLYFTRQRAHALVQQDDDGITLEWFDDPIHGETEFTRDELDEMLAMNHVKIVATDFHSLENFHVWSKYKRADPRTVNPGGAPSPKWMTLTAERGSGSRERVDGFLMHPEIDYQYNPTGNPFRITLTAQFADRDVAMATLSTPSSPDRAGNGTIALDRFCAHPDRPDNTGTWMLKRAGEWARLEGYDQIISYAGVANDNRGHLYYEAGFEKIDESEADLSNWNNRGGRDASGTYTRRVWMKDISPDNSHNLPSRRYDERKDSSLKSFETDTDDEAEPATQEDIVITREADIDTRSGTLEGYADDVLELVDIESYEDDEVAAIFGVRNDTRLVGAAVVTDDTREGRDNFQSVTISEVGVRDVRWELDTKRFLVSRVRRWADLHGYKRVHAVTPTAGSDSVYAGEASFEQVEGDGGSPSSPERSEWVSEF